MSIELATAYVSIVPSAKGIAASVAKELAPIEGAAATQGLLAGKALGGSLSTAVGSQIAPVATSLLKRITTGLTSPAGIAALGAAAFVGLVSVGKQFASVNRIIRQETGATGSTLEGLASTVKRVFADAPESLQQVTQAVDELFKRGIPLGGQLDKLARQELFLSKITGSDLATTVEQTTAVFAKFSVPVRDQSRALDVLFKAQQRSGKGLDELVSGLQRAGGVLQQFGFNLNESAALIAGLEKAGVNVQPALAGLRLAFGKITQAGGNPEQVLRGLIKQLTEGKHPTEAMAAAIKLFGNRSGSELAIAIQKGKLNITEMLKLITDGRGGILATGQATLTLAEKFTIFKHRALLDLSEFGASALKVFSSVVNEGGPILGDLVASITRVVQQLAPALAPIGLLLVGAFKVALPVLSALATGINTVASVLSHFPAPVIGAAAALGALFLGLRALNAAGGFVSAAAGLSSFLADLNPVTATIVVAAAAVTALGAVMKIFGSHSDNAKKEAKALGQAMFDASSQSGLFAAGISSATQGVEAFLKAQIAGGKADFLKGVLLATGTTVNELSGHLTAGKDAWDTYTKAIAKSLVESQGISAQADSLVHVSDKVISTLNDQRKAFETNAVAELSARVANGELKQSDLDVIESRRKNTDGTINYARVLDRVNSVLAEQAFKQDQVATGNIQTSRTYAQLANAISTGTISTVDATKALTDLGFSAEGSKTKLADLTSEAKSFATSVGNALQSGADEVKAFGQQVSTDNKAVEADVKQKASILHRLALAGGKASTALKDSLAQNTKKIIDDLHVLAADSDPNKFTDNLRTQAINAAKFLGNLRTLVAEGFGNLAGFLAKQGPEAAGALAAGLASNESKARLAGSAADLLTTTNDSIVAFAQGNFAQLNGIGEGMAKAVSERFKPDLTPGISPALAAAERALAADGRVTRATGDVGVAAVQKFSGKLTLNEAVKLALTAAHEVLIGDATIPDAAGGVAARTSARFTPQFSGRISAQINAAQAALAGDPNISQAAGRKALEIVGKFGAALTLPAAAKLAVQQAHDAMVADPSLKVAGGAVGKATADEFGKKTDLPAKTKAAFDAAANIIPQLTSTATAAGTAGHAVGVAFDTGMVQGIDGHAIDVYSAGARVGQKAVDGAKSTIKPGSPSKVGIVLGGQFSEGLALGITAKAPAAFTAAAKMASQAVAGVTAGLGDSAIVSSALSALPTIGQQISDFASKASAALATLRADTQKALEATTKLADSQRRAAAAYAKAIALIPVAAAAAAKLARDLAAKASPSVISADRAVASGSRSAANRALTDTAKALGDVTKAEQALAAATRQRAQDQRAAAALADPALFAAQVRRQTQFNQAFETNIRRLVKLGDLNLARKLLEEGPQQGLRLAQLLARSPKDAAATEKALKREQEFEKHFQEFVSKTLGGGLGTQASETGASVGAELLKGITDFLKAGGNATTVKDQIKKILGGKSTGTEVGKEVTAGLSSELAAFKEAPVRVAKPKPKPLRSFAELRDFTVTDARAAVASPQRLQIELVLDGDVLAKSEFDLTGQRLQKMKARVRGAVQAIG